MLQIPQSLHPFRFFAQFKEKIGKDVDFVEFATLTAWPKTFTFFGLEPPPGQNELAGLLVFCKDALYFYVFPTDNIFRLAMQRMAGDMENKEQCFCLSELKEVDLSFSARKSFRFLFPKQSRTVRLSAKFNLQAVDFTLCFTKDAATLISELTSRLSLRS